MFLQAWLTMHAQLENTALEGTQPQVALLELTTRLKEENRSLIAWKLLLGTILQLGRLST